jgi:hypothetical protein
MLFRRPFHPDDANSPSLIAHSNPSPGRSFNFLTSTMTNYHYKKPYSPSRQVFPRRFLEPWRILVVVIILFLLLFFRFDTNTAPVPLSTPGDVATSKPGSTKAGSHAPVGFRPLNDSKIAIVTFHTDQKSYTHLSLKNKFREFIPSALQSRVYH